MKVTMKVTLLGPSEEARRQRELREGRQLLQGCTELNNLVAVPLEGVQVQTLEARKILQAVQQAVELLRRQPLGLHVDRVCISDDLEHFE